MSDRPYKHPDDLVLTERRGSVTVLTMNDPERGNRLSRAMCAALRAAFRELFVADAETSAIVLTGAGGNFCAGGGEAGEEISSPLAARDGQVLAAKLFREIFSGAKPVISAVEGDCADGGLALACASDIVITSGTGKFQCAFVKAGLVPDTGLLWTLPRRVGPGRARQLMLDGRVFDADAAVAWGVANEKTGEGGAVDRAVERGRPFGAYPPATLAALKGALVNGANSVDDAWRLEIDLNPLVRNTEDHKEAIAAFMEKRQPVFKGY